MAGIYLHIPFCKQACSYCDFHFSTSLKLKEDILLAMQAEMEHFRSFFPGATTLDTLYLGGGTPSVLKGDELKQLIGHTISLFPFNENAELTLEANPDDLDKDKIRSIQQAGVNRLSIGIQSFRDMDLKLMNRSHSAQQADYAVKLSQDAGIENITIDLIYGIPGLSQQEWSANVDQAIDLEVPHVSAYALTVEEKTALAFQVEKEKVIMPGDQVFQQHYLTLIDRLTSAGFDHYELSNFGKPGWHSRHNKSYWEGKPYLGIGPSAHSYRTSTRHWNVANNARYIKGINEAGQAIDSTEELTEKDEFNEFLLTGLRLTAGIDMDVLASRFGQDRREILANALGPWLEKEWVIREGSNIRLSPLGLLMSNAIISDLFEV